MDIIGIIPARFDSSRFPGKPLALLGNKPLVRCVYEQASKELDRIFVATDDKRIEKAVRDFGGEVIMTSSKHRSGTDRCAEAVSIMSKNNIQSPDVIINIQGDEPFIQPEQIRMLSDSFKDPGVKISTLVKRINNSKDLHNPNIPKVVLSDNYDALYFSRSVIPYIRDNEGKDTVKEFKFYKHIGIYGFRTETLLKLSKLSNTELEQAESLEQLRWLQNGYKIRVSVTESESFGIDTPEDMENANVMLKRD